MKTETNKQVESVLTSALNRGFELCEKEKDMKKVKNFFRAVNELQNKLKSK